MSDCAAFRRLREYASGSVSDEDVRDVLLPVGAAAALPELHVQGVGDSETTREQNGCADLHCALGAARRADLGRRSVGRKQRPLRLPVDMLRFSESVLILSSGPQRGAIDGERPEGRTRAARMGDPRQAGAARTSAGIPH